MREGLQGLAPDGIASLAARPGTILSDVPERFAVARVAVEAHELQCCAAELVRTRLQNQRYATLSILPITRPSSPLTQSQCHVYLRSAVRCQGEESRHKRGSRLPLVSDYGGSGTGAHQQGVRGSFWRQRHEADRRTRAVGQEASARHYDRTARSLRQSG